jgi:flavorubredoxin
MKCLIAYYSHSGTTEKAATARAAYLEEKGHFATVERISPKKDYSKLSAYALGCMQAQRKERIELLPVKNEPAKFDLIAVLSPTWAFTCAPPAHSFAASLPNARKGQKAVAITTHGGTPADSAKDLAKVLSGKGYEVIASFSVGMKGKFDEATFEGRLKV